MGLTRYIVIFYFFMSTIALVGQVDTSGNSFSSDTSDFSFDTSGFFTFTQEEVEQYLVYKPILYVGWGNLSFLGDVRDNYYTNPLVGRHPFTAGINRKINQEFSLDFNIIKGNMSGIERNNGRNLNFMTDVFIGGVSVNYNFGHILKKPNVFLPLEEQRILLPFFSLGIESIFFNSKTDMKDAQGRTYHYWSDGTIRDLPEKPENEMSSVVLQRDYVYETDLRELDLDGLGKYRQTGFAIPIGLGVDFNFSKRTMLRVGASYHMSFDDLIDNISTAGKADRKGDAKNDNFFYTYISFKFDIFKSEKVVELDDMGLNTIDFEAIDNADEDQDGVIDLWDESPETPESVEVDSVGRPIDSDVDGVPDYRDGEKFSEDTAIVGTDGVTLTDEQKIYLTTMPEAIDEDQICLYYPALCGMTPLQKRRYEEVPQNFKSVDKNNDGYISLDELNDVLDAYFDFKTNLTIDDIYELTNFFFAQ